MSARKQMRQTIKNWTPEDYIHTSWQFPVLFSVMYSYVLIFLQRPGQRPCENVLQGATTISVADASAPSFDRYERTYQGNWLAIPKYQISPAQKFLVHNGFNGVLYLSSIPNDGDCGELCTLLAVGCCHDHFRELVVGDVVVEHSFLRNAKSVVLSLAYCWAGSCSRGCALRSACTLTWHVQNASFEDVLMWDNKV